MRLKIALKQLWTGEHEEEEERKGRMKGLAHWRC